MLKSEKWPINLQLFADGGEGGDGGAESGAEAGDAGRQALRDLGVPEGKIRDKTAKKVAGMVNRSRPEGKTESQPSTNAQTEETGISWEQVKNDPECNRQIQQIVQARLKEAKASEDNLKALSPALELIAGQYGMDTAAMDYSTLAHNIIDDDRYYEDQALSSGRTIEDEKHMAQLEREAREAREVREQNLQQQMMQQHIQKLKDQADSLAEQFPDLDLIKELQNPTFRRMTSPSGGLSVEQAYRALHGAEIDAAVAAAATKRVTNAVQSNGYRPREASAETRSPSAATVNQPMSKAQRDQLKKQIFAAESRGEYIRPN